MKQLYKNLKQPKTWDIFKYNPIKDEYFAEKEYQRLLTQYDAMGIFFIHLQTELRLQVNLLRMFENLSGVAIVSGAKKNRWRIKGIFNPIFDK